MTRSNPVRLSAILTLMLTLACGITTSVYPSPAASPDEGASRQALELPMGPDPTRPDWIGRARCAPCHEREDELYKGSDHDLAMQVVNDETVVGSTEGAFDGATHEYGGVTSTFYRDGDRYMVRTDGPDGELHDFEIAYTFGHEPLQQYLIAFDDGYYQCLNVCWDTNPDGSRVNLEEGSGRWFHLYPNEVVDHLDELHWTGPNQNWNFMCAECHSTDLRKNYSIDEDRYATDWFEIDVSCEACHGPGREHELWAREKEAAEKAGRAPPPAGDMGLVVRLKDSNQGEWILDPETGNAQRSVERSSRIQVDTCARCHSRRRVVDDEYVYGRPLLQTHLPALLSERLYYPDGQILDEVYVYASFLQSKMYHAGVTCSDCHDAHSGKPMSPDNSLCYRCHAPEKFDTRSHHMHVPGTKGSGCVECHMPETPYMVVDPRRDHSMRVPRPDLSLRLGSPNACTWSGCHADKGDRWALEKCEWWYGEEWDPEPHYGEALQAGRRGVAGAQDRLIALLADAEQPPIVRGTAATLLPWYPSAESVRALSAAAASDEALIRLGVASAAADLPLEARVPVAESLVSDPMRAVRTEAARALVSVPWEEIPYQRRPAMAAATDELIAAQRINGDRAESHIQLGVTYFHRGDLAQAEAAYRHAIELNPRLGGGYVNLADLLRAQGRDAEGEVLLNEALAELPDDGDLHHVLGLLYVRTGRVQQSIPELEAAARLRPDNPRYPYVLGIALNSTGDGEGAIAALEGGLKDHPTDTQILFALATMSRDRGDRRQALVYAQRLVELNPSDRTAKALLAELQAGGR